ncbi:MAG: hypothetical protein Q4D57_04515 [Clostridia bacterium]|nr:hypothetical protein [Clostridia bacterium]
MKLKKLFLMLMIPIFCGLSIFSPVFASSNKGENKISFKRPRTYMTDSPSIFVTAFGIKFKVIINGFNDRPFDEVRRGVESYVRSWGEVTINRLRAWGVTEIFLDEYVGALHALVSSSPGDYPEPFHKRMVGERLVLIVPEDLVFCSIK